MTTPVSPTTELPVEQALPQLATALRGHGCLVLTAEPGAGKTTRVPLFLSEALALPGEVIVTEPRRLAARLAASYVATLSGSPLGKRVGYSVRFEEVASAETKVRYVTEGILLRRLVAEPGLPKVSCVVLDEFHERHLATDELLTLLAELRRRRPDLLLVVMSATLDPAPLQTFLGGCPHVHVPGKSYPLTVVHDAEVDDRPLEKRVTSAVRQALRSHEQGDVLVFLPGTSEIFAAQDALNAADLGVTVCPLYGELPLEAQRLAVTASSKRRVVLSTNVAESSVTVDGVRIVVDTGLSKVAAVSPWSGRSVLRTEPISKNSAVQRAGRAARQGPGTVYRLYPEARFKTLSDHDSPEIERTDLAPLLLDLAALGVPDPLALPWLCPPPIPALNAASALLAQLGAISDGRLTAVGQYIADSPLPPRCARVLLEGKRLGIEEHARLAVALLSERDVRTRDQRTNDLPTEQSDLVERIDRTLECDFGRQRPAFGVDRARLAAVRRVFDQLAPRRRKADENDEYLSPDERDERLGKALLAGFGDRVAKRKTERGCELVLRDGSSARLSEQSVVRVAPFVIALDVDDQLRGKTTTPVVRLASAVEPEWLLEAFSDAIDAVEELVFDVQKQRVESSSRLTLGSVTLEESRLPAKPSAEAGALLFAYARNQRAQLFGKDSRVDNLRHRLRLLAQYEPNLGLPAAQEWDDEALLRHACEERTSFAELEHLDFGAWVVEQLTPPQLAALHTLCPERVQLKTGHSLEVHYEYDKPPWIQSRIQDFFGQDKTPRVLRDKVPLTIHLLAPNKRPVQVTNDLESFWTRHYATVRKELRQRYPKHHWPEDGRVAEAPPPGKLRPPTPK